MNIPARATGRGRAIYYDYCRLGLLGGAPRTGYSFTDAGYTRDGFTGYGPTAYGSTEYMATTHTQTAATLTIWRHPHLRALTIWRHSNSWVR